MHIEATLKHERLKALISEDLQKGVLKPGDKLPSQNQMAEMYGISPGTVREAIASLVNEGLLYRIQGKGTFVSDIKTQNRIFALIMPHHQNLKDNDFISGNDLMGPLIYYIQDEAFKNNIDLLLYLNDDSIEQERLNIQKALDRNVDGIIIFYIGYESNDEYLKKIVDSNVSLVMIDRYLKDKNIDHVGTNNYNGAFEAVKLLQENGFKKIYHITSLANISSIVDRQSGYEDAMHQAGLEIRILPQCNANSSNRHIEQESFEVVDNLLKTDKEKMAFFAANCHMALGANKAIMNSKINPNNFGLAFFDQEFFNIDENIFVISIHQPLHIIARKSVNVLINKINHNSAPEKIFVEPSVEIKQNLMHASMEEVKI
jgi:GntR family transcriptional regulator of arabinose operon